MAGFFDDLINDPRLNLGVGLLAASGPSTQPVNFGQALATGLQFASAAQQRQQVDELQRARIQEARERLLDRARQQRVGSALAEFIDVIGPQAATAALPGAAGHLPGDATTPLAAPSILSHEQASLLRRLAPIAPDFVGQQIAGLLFAEAQPPTNLQREYEFLTSVGVDSEKALEALRKGTVVNVGGGAEEPLSIADLEKVRLPDGSPVPIGTTPSQAHAMGATVVSGAELDKQREVEGALALLDTLDQLSDDVLGGVEPGFLNRAAAGLNNTIELLTQNDPAVAQLKSLSEGSVAKIVRAFGERGALAEGDVARALALIPEVGDLSNLQLPDTAATAKAKLKQLRDLLEKGVRNLESAAPQSAPPAAPEPEATEAPAAEGGLSAADQKLLTTPADHLSPAEQSALDALLKRMGF